MNVIIKSIVAGMVLIASCNNNKSETTEIESDTSATMAANDTTANMQMDGLMPAMNSMMDKMQSMKMTGDFDMDFANMMIEHHQGAIDMSKVQVEKGSDEKLKSMAQSIITKQTAEIEQLRSIISKHKAHGMIHGEGGLMESMNTMKQKMSGPMSGNTDRDFATMMIAHHEGSIDMSEKQIANGMNDQLKAMAKKSISDQKKEIGALKAWLDANK